MKDDSSFYDFLDQVAHDPTVTKHRAEVLRRYEANPGRLLFTRHADGRTFDWEGGDIAIVTEEFWHEIYEWLPYMPWELCVLMNEWRDVSQVFYVVRAP